MWQISKGRIDRLIIFVDRDGQTRPCGEVFFEGNGRMRLSTFRYARSWRSDPESWSLAPGRLPLQRNAFLSAPHEVVLPLYDSGPDGWGKTVLSHAYPNQVFGMGEYLASAGDNRTGELRFGPTPEEKPQRWLPQGEALVDLPDESETLKSLLDAATALEAGEPSRHHIRTLIRAGADVGGARPKARIFKNDRTEWIAKFPASDDVFDDPRVEAVCLSLARKAGIVVPDHEIIEIGGRAVLLVSRFDRAADGARLGYSSAATLLGQATTGYGTDYTYADVAAKARTVGIEPCEQEIFKRLLFNCFIRNTDDHLRNHGFVRDKYGWRISPAFDLVVHRGRRLVLRAGSGIDPIPDARLAFGAWKQFHLNFKQAVQIYEEVTEALGSLPCLLEEFSVRTVDRLLLKELMGQAFNPQPLASG